MPWRVNGPMGPPTVYRPRTRTESASFTSLLKESSLHSSSIINYPHLTRDYRRKMAIGPPQSTTPTAIQSHVHPHISQSHDPAKGRQLHATAPVKTGDVLMVDPPYAVIPVVDDPLDSDEVICSNSECRRKVPRDGRVRRIGCPNRCAPEVVWCDAVCRDADRVRHGLECSWLKGYAAALRKDEGEYYFGVLWLIVRVLATRYMEKQQASSVSRSKERFSSGWTAMTELCDNRKLWPEADLLQWKSLVEKYICADSSPLQHILLSADKILTLICQQESNSFGLYPRATGLASTSDRGEQYGAAIYPRSSIANHSCCPNITHKPDNHGRMVFTASRDIAPGEECCISYMDLFGDVDVNIRRKHLREQFSFTCQCERCRAEEKPEEGWDALPFVDEQ